MMELSPLAASNGNFSFAARLIRDLADLGVSHFAISAGSRSAPLAASAATTPGVSISTHIDERSAAFFALGRARFERAPVALVCTSGTAAANFAPAVAEADRAGVPLILLTADRPAELRDRGAPQTIDQVRLYGSHARWFHEPPPPTAVETPAKLARGIAERTVAEALGRSPGPVHLNLPFREPLAPTGEPAPTEDLRALSARGTEHSTLSGDGTRTLEAALETAARPIFVVGPWDPELASARALVALARRVGAPVLAEPLSGLRAGFGSDGLILATADAILRAPAFAEAMAPDLVLRVGAPPTSKALGRWISASSAATVFALDPSVRRQDPDLRVDVWVDASPDALPAASAGSGVRDLGWVPAWQAAEKRAWGAIQAAVLASKALLPPVAFAALAPALGGETTLYLSNSMAVRDAETFLPPLAVSVRMLGNRGANGIDGVLSSALGAASTGQPVVLATGDLALLHDSGAWWTARRLNLPITVLAFNDGGGGIFDYLPIAAEGDRVRFEEVFRVAHGQALAPVAEAFGCAAEVVRDREALCLALSAAEGPTLLEIRFDPADNRALHRRVWADVATALEEGTRS